MIDNKKKNDGKTPGVEENKETLFRVAIREASMLSMDDTSSIFCWFCPICPRCNGFIGQKLASSRLVCMNCKTEFEITEVDDPDK